MAKTHLLLTVASHPGLAFVADARTHEEVLLPVWHDVAHADGWACDIARRAKPPDADRGVPLKASRDYRHPPNWGNATA